MHTYIHVYYYSNSSAVIDFQSPEISSSTARTAQIEISSATTVLLNTRYLVVGSTIFKEKSERI